MAYHGAAPNPGAGARRVGVGAGLLLSLILALLIASPPPRAGAQERDINVIVEVNPGDPSGEEAKPLDKIIEIKGQLWGTTLDIFSKHFEDHGFEWLSASKQAVRSVHPGLTLFGHPVGETVLRSDAGNIDRVAVSIYNRGDNGVIRTDQFEEIVSAFESQLGEALGVRKEDSNSAVGSGVKSLDRRLWYTEDSAVLLESSIENGRPEFIRLRMGPKPQGAMYLGNAAGVVQKTATRSEIAGNVQRESKGDVYIQAVPMVDQGEKGYCVVASAERVFRYYGLDVDQHEIAQLAGSTAERGTSSLEIHNALRSASGGLGLRVFDIIGPEDEKSHESLMKAYNREARKRLAEEVPESPYQYQLAYYSIDGEILKDVKLSRGNYFQGFQKDVMDNIDAAFPLMWSVLLGMFEEPDIPQAFGGHLRLIIGYNATTNEIIYSDSWGPGHEKKRMPMDQAYTITKGLYLVKPSR